MTDIQESLKVLRTLLSYFVAPCDSSLEYYTLIFFPFSFFFVFLLFIFVSMFSKEKRMKDKDLECLTIFKITESKKLRNLAFLLITHHSS